MTSPRIALAAFAAAALAAPLAAQGTCDLEVRKPFQLTSAIVYLSKHDQSTVEADRLKFIQSAVKVLTDNPGRIGNPAGRNYLLGQAYVRWFQDGGQKPRVQATRGDVGFSENPEGVFVLPEALDEALGVVEREKPACADSTARYRGAVFARVLNTAIAFYNGKQYDSAIAYANFALKANARSASVGMAYQVLSNSSQATGDLAGAIASLQQAIAVMGTDTASARSKATATYKLAALTRDQAMKQEGDARRAGLRQAATAFKAYLDMAPDGENAAAARASYARALQDAGDTAGVESVYGDMMANPGKYTALQLFEAAVVQANGQHLDDAARLYEAGLQMNPNYRDALFNLSNVYFAQHLPEKMAPVVARLRAVDPMNGDVLKLAGAVWQERGRQAADPKALKAAQDSVRAYVARSGALPARVTVTQFTVAPTGTAVLVGRAENLGAAPASHVISFELLDRAGSVVGTAEVKLDAMAPKATAEFKTQLAAATAVAWRYTFK
ncbi:MAG: tetratricopeptide repeat protein [Gemmatimonadaceae bacterium]